MATTAPQPPRPPQPPLPPPPPRQGSNALPIVLLVLGLIILLSGVAIWGGLHFLAHNVKVQVSQGINSKEVTIKTPFGGMEVNKNIDVTEASLGLPIYPDARPLKDDHSASVSLGLPGEKRLRIVAGKFETSDSLEKVRDFYQNRLTAQDGPFTKEARIDSDHHDLDDKDTGNFMGVDEDGKTVFKLRQKGDERVVALEKRSDGTRIELVRVSKSTEEPN
jgi:hypothetical protein